MSLSDHLKYLRAQKGGIEPREIQAQTGISEIDFSWMERKYRRVGENDAQLQKIASFFGVPFDDLSWRRERYRKKLTEVLFFRQRTGEPVTLRLRGGVTLSGKIIRADRQAIRVQVDDRPAPFGEVVVYRHAVEDWS